MAVGRDMKAGMGMDMTMDGILIAEEAGLYIYSLLWCLGGRQGKRLGKCERANEYDFI